MTLAVPKLTQRANAVFPPKKIPNSANKLSRIANVASVEARVKAGYLKAAEIHAKAADAQKAAGNEKFAAAHDAMSDALAAMANVSPPAIHALDDFSAPSELKNPPPSNNPPQKYDLLKITRM